MDGYWKSHVSQPALVLAIALLAGGCRTPGGNSTEVSGVEPDGKALPPTLRVTLGMIGLTSSARTENLSYAAPARPGEAASTITERTFEWLHPDHDEEWDVFCNERTTFSEEFSDFAASALISLVTGFAGGFIAGTDDETLRKAERSIRQGMAKSRFADDVGRQIGEIARTRADVSLVPLSNDQLPGFGQTNYTVFAAHGIQTALEIVVFTTRLRPGEGFNPPMRLEASVHVHLTRVADGVALYSAAFDYGGSSRKFANWAADDAKLLRAEIQSCSRQFAQRIVEHLFGEKKE